ncbi:MAG: glycosyltransferase [Bacteroidota bacterium]
MIFLCLFFWGIYLLILAALVGGWRSASRKETKGTTQPAFSIIIAARNESPNLKQYLSSWLGQAYPAFELIIVLDRCEDDSATFLASQVDPRLKLIEISETPEGWAPKKWALRLGIAAAQNDWLAFTDADCELSPDWLAELAQKIEPHTDLILGLGPYRQYPSLLNALQSFETSYTALQYMGFARLGMPYMGVGRNLAYQKSFFERSAGFDRFAERLSGDDDLLVNANANASNTALMMHPSSWTWSEPKMSWSAWFRQKNRHLSASPAYSAQSKLVLGIFHCSHLAGNIFWLAEFFLAPTNLFLWGLLITRVLMGWILWGAVKPSFDRERLLMLYPLLDFLFFLYNLIFVPIGTIRKPSWTKKQESQKIRKKTES